MSRETPSAADRILNRLKNNPILAIVVTVATIIIGVGAFTDALSKIGQFVEPSPPPPVEQARAPLPAVPASSTQFMLTLDVSHVPSGTQIDVTAADGSIVASTSTSGGARVTIPIDQRFLGKQLTVRVRVQGYSRTETTITARTDARLVLLLDSLGLRFARPD